MITLHLHQVTLVCFDTRNIDVALDSMYFSLNEISYYQNILFTSKKLCNQKHIEKAKKYNIKIEFINEISSLSEYSYFILARLSDYINSNYCLVTQWDGWVINKKSWDSNFLNYDYIGAVWPHYKENKVGNGGFSLRSKKLLESSKKLVEVSNDYPNPLVEDDYICREKRLTLESKFQIKFPNTTLANKFSLEGAGPPINSFGFHGMSNFNFVIQKDLELINFLDNLNNDYFMNRESYLLAKNLINEKRHNAVKYIIKKRFKANGISKKHFKLLFFLWINILLKKKIINI